MKSFKFLIIILFLNINSFAQKSGDGKTDWSPWIKTCFANLYVSIKCNGYTPDIPDGKNWAWNIRFKNTGNQNSHFSVDSWFLQTNERFTWGRWDVKANSESTHTTLYYKTPPPAQNKNISDFWGFKITRYIENPTDDWTIKSYACNGIYAVCDYNCNEKKSQANSNNSSTTNQNTQNSANTSQNSTGSSGTSSMNRGGNVVTGNSNSQNPNNLQEEIARQQQEKIRLQQEKTNQEVERANQQLDEIRKKHQENIKNIERENTENQELINKNLENTINLINNAYTNSIQTSNENSKNNDAIIKKTQDEFAVNNNFTEKKINSLLTNNDPNNYTIIKVYNKIGKADWHILINGKEVSVNNKKNSYIEYKIFLTNKLNIQVYGVGDKTGPIKSISTRISKGKSYNFIIKKQSLAYNIEELTEEPLDNKGNQIYQKIYTITESDIEQ